MLSYREKFEQMERLIRDRGAKIRFKDETWWMRLIGQFLRLLGIQRFMTEFTTTLWKTIYFPSKKYVEEYPRKAFCVAAHELVHIWRYQHSPFSYVVWSLRYLYPHILAVLGFLGILGIVWWSPLIVFFGFFLLITPLMGKMKATWRLAEELMAYAASSCSEMWVDGKDYAPGYVSPGFFTLEKSYSMWVPKKTQDLVAAKALSYELRSIRPFDDLGYLLSAIREIGRK